MQWSNGLDLCLLHYGMDEKHTQDYRLFVRYVVNIYGRELLEVVGVVIESLSIYL